MLDVEVAEMNLATSRCRRLSSTQAYSHVSHDQVHLPGGFVGAVANNHGWRVEEVDQEEVDQEQLVALEIQHCRRPSSMQGSSLLDHGHVHQHGSLVGVVVRSHGWLVDAAAKVDQGQILLV